VSLPFPVLVLLASALAAWFVDWQVLLARTATWGAALPGAVGVNLALASVAGAIGAVTPVGAFAGVVLGTLLILGAGWAAWWLLVASAVVATVTTSVGKVRKAHRGIAEPRRGRRGARNVIANAGVGTLIALVAASRPEEPALQVAVAVALATGASDTAASEIGKAVGGRTWQLPWLEPVPAGTTGAVSVAGTAAGVAAAALFGGLAVVTALVPANQASIVVGVTVAAVMTEGVLAVLLETRRVIDNDGVNFLTGLAAAALAVAIVR
jgi:uncharacterized protein (TIGR00297 family)